MSKVLVQICSEPRMFCINNREMYVPCKVWWSRTYESHCPAWIVLCQQFSHWSNFTWKTFASFWANSVVPLCLWQAGQWNLQGNLQVTSSQFMEMTCKNALLRLLLRLKNEKFERLQLQPMYRLLETTGILALKRYSYDQPIKFVHHTMNCCRTHHLKAKGCRIEWEHADLKIDDLGCRSISRNRKQMSSTM